MPVSVPVSAPVSVPPSAQASTTQVEERTDTTLDTSTTSGSGDHDRFAHYVNKVKLTESAVSGKAVVALCGKKWVPTRDAQQYPVCPTCKEIYAKLGS